MNNHCFFTSFNKAYGFQALTLAHSLRRVYGDSVDIVAIMVDELAPGEIEYFDVFDRVIEVRELGIPDFMTWIFRLDIVEAATAVKPFALCELLGSYRQVTYLDPDIKVYTPLLELHEDGYRSCFITPHQVTSHRSERWLVESTELESLKFGIYNLGFLSVRDSKAGWSVAEWWRDRCYHYCLSEPERGLFTDQKFFDGAPAMFPEVEVLRHPGYNVATWNLRERIVEFEPSTGVSVNGHPLRFCHFTKATHIGGYALERMIEKKNIFFMELFYSYIAELEQRRIELSGINADWAYGRYQNGDPIPKEARISHRRSEGWSSIPNPFVLT